MEQSILLLGQSINSITYNRRLNILSALSLDRQKAKDLEIDFNTNPFQNKIPQQAKMSQQEWELINQEVMLAKSAIQKVSLKRDHFLSNLFLVPKKDWDNRPVINLKNLNTFTPYIHFKMEGLHPLKEMLKEGDYLCKIDLKDAYFSVPLYRRH